MINLILKEWLVSIYIFSPKNIFNFLVIWFLGLLNSIKIFLKFFWTLILVDVVFQFLFGDLIAQAGKLLTDANASVNFVALFFYFVKTLIWYLIIVSCFVSIKRASEKEINFIDLKIDFFRYVQFSLIFSFLVLLFINLLIILGVTVYPNVPQFLLSFFKIVEILILFYWLDSNFSFKDIFISIEKALNFVLYNFPLILLCFLFEFGLNKFLKPNENIIWIRYLELFLHTCLVVFVFSIYKLRKNLFLYESIFDKNVSLND